MTQPHSTQELLAELAALRTRLAEAEDTLTAIRQGRVDAVVVDGPQGEQIFTLQGADQPYRVMIESMQEGAVTLTADGTILFSNQSFARLVQTPLEQILGSNLRQFIAAIDHAQFAILLEHGCAVSSAGELPLMTSDGAQVPVALSLTSLRTYDVPAVCVVVTDLTDQKRYTELAAVQQALHESESRLRLALEAAHLGTWESNTATGMFWFSPEMETLWGLAPGTFPGTFDAFLATVHPEDRARVQQVAQQVATDQSLGRQEYRIIRPDGTIRWIAALGQSFVSTPDGPVCETRGVVMDITTRKQTEEASRWLAAIVESSDDAIISKSLDGIVTSWNATAERLFGYRTEEMLGQPILRLLPEDRHAEEYMILDCLRRGERVDPFETVRRTKDGHMVDVSLTISPIRDEHGSIIGASKIARDITQRKQMERELACRATELQRVHDELQQFSYIVAHDLNAPLRTMGNFANLLARRYQNQLDATADEYISFVTDAAQRMQQMLTDLLAYTRVGGPTGTFTVVDSEALFTRVLSELQIAIADGKAEVTHDPLPTVLGDGIRLGQVLQNLIGNALKFRGGAAPRIHVSAQRDGQHWRFTVGDNGIGIDPQQAGRLFQVFQRLHTHSEYPGTGIGLAICKKIVERHGGRIWVESQPGEGSIFYFTIKDS